MGGEQGTTRMFEPQEQRAQLYIYSAAVQYVPFSCVQFCCRLRGVCRLAIPCSRVHSMIFPGIGSVVLAKYFWPNLGVVFRDSVSELEAPVEYSCPLLLTLCPVPSKMPKGRGFFSSFDVLEAQESIDLFFEMYPWGL